MRFRAATPTPTSLPLWTNLRAGLIFKYQKWGVEQFGHFNNGALKPFIRAATARQVFRETVEITNEQGQKETLSVPGAFLPMARYILVLAAVGAGTEWLLEQLFGRWSKTASLAEIMCTWKRDKTTGFAKAMDKVWGYMLDRWGLRRSGQLHANGQGLSPSASGYKNPLDPPGLRRSLKRSSHNGPVRSAGRDQAGRSWTDALTTVVAQYRTGKQGGSTGAGRVRQPGDQGAGSVARRQDYSWLKSVTRRFDKSISARENVRSYGRAGRSQTSVFRDRLFEDLMPR